MRKFVLAVALSSAASILTAQFPVCGTDAKLKELLGKYPEMQVEMDSIDQWLLDNAEVYSNQRGSVKIIPTVVHIIHNYGPENISDARVADAIRFLNEDFLGISSDLSGVIPAFTSIQGDPQFEFRLATLDPNSNCTNGITHTWSTLTYDAGDESKVVSWPRNKYYNIWVVFNIYTDPNEPGVIAGYSYFPGGFTPANVDGTIVGYNYCGVGSSNFAKRVISHESGHWFNLRHPWGNGSIGSCGGSDAVGDTPETSGSFSTCDLNKSDCGPLANVQNIMDYSSCTNMFTDGQSTRMITAANSGTASRNNLWTTGNLNATGTNDPYTPSNCAPIADFHSSRYSVCAGTSITLIDDSWNANVTSRNWTVTNGVDVFNDTASSAVFTLNTPGIYDVTLTVSAPGGNDTETRNGYIYVFDNVATYVTAPYVEDFEGGAISSNEWSVLYSPDPVNGWQETNVAFVSSNTSIRVHNYLLPAGQQHTIISPTYDFTTTGIPVSMTFKVAYAKTSSSQDMEYLKLWGSSNCGQSWQLRATWDSDDLVTGGVKTTDWVPNSGQWQTMSVASLNAYNNKPNVLFKFEFQTRDGNNLYIDDINITGPIGLEESTNEDLQLVVYPNPVEQQINIDFTVDKEYTAKFSLVDITGKTVAVFGMAELLTGNNHFTYNIPFGTAPGLYFLNMEAGNKLFSKKIMIQ